MKHMNMLLLYNEVPGFSQNALPQQPSGLEPGIVAFEPQALTH